MNVPADHTAAPAPTMKKLLASLLLLAAILGLPGCAVYHHYGPYMGKVVDAETGEPIEGAAVLAVYKTQSYTLAGSISHFLDAQEVVTDQNGEFTVPPLNSLTFRPLQSFEAWAWTTIFKPGYAGYGCTPWHEKVEPRKWPFQPKKYVVIKLPKLKTKEERYKYHSCDPSPSVPGNRYPKLFDFINEERKFLGFRPIPKPQ
jgi:hypothetical protein